MGLLGLDIGTSGCKATIFDYDGTVKGQSYVEYSLVSPQPGWQELDPEVVWNSVKQVIISALSSYRGEAIKAISVSSFGESVIPVDQDGNVLYNSIMYIDPRGGEEANALEEMLGIDEVLSITGVSIHPMYSLSKIMWIKKHIPDVYGCTWKFLL
jgi:xylulokinase